MRTPIVSFFCEDSGYKVEEKVTELRVRSIIKSRRLYAGVTTRTTEAMSTVKGTEVVATEGAEIPEAGAAGIVAMEEGMAEGEDCWIVPPALSGSWLGLNQD